MVLMAALGLGRGGAACGQSDRPLDGQIDDLAFLHYYGSGTYEVGAERVWVLRIPPVFMVKAIEPDRTGILLRSALVLAIEDFSDFLEPDITERRLYSLSAGIEFLIPVGRLKTLKPYFDIGYGADNDLDRASLIAGAGIRAELIQLWKKWRIGVEPSVAFAASRRLPNLELGGEYSEFAMKLSARHPLPFEFASGTPDAGIYTAGSYLFESLTVLDEDRSVKPVRGLLEVGVVFGFQTPRPTILFFKPPSISIGYQFGNGFRGLRIGMGGDWYTPIPLDETSARPP